LTLTLTLTRTRTRTLTLTRTLALTLTLTFSQERKAVAEVFAKVSGENALKRDTPAAHPRVGFVCMGPEQAVTVLGAVAAR